MKIKLFLILIVVSVLLLGCSLNPTEKEEKIYEDEPGSRYLQTWDLWEPLNSYNSGQFEKANWTNGGMFNCGWLPEKATFNNGKLTLKLDNTYSHGKSYSSGEYRTKNTFSYGTFEVNMKAVKANGVVTSFFLYTGSPWDEIDVEILGKDTRKVQFNYYVNGVGSHEAVIDLGFDAAYGFHKYAIEYGNGYINWYVDGVWKYGVNNRGFNAPYGAAMPSHPMQIMVNLWPGIGVDSWLNHFYYNGPLYAEYDYISYKKR
ncbi:MAG: family 16 glycosylhydrolase [Spirochaetales bacterium]|nr:family 16 glycosylhydrolase [Spirochaetales bacterium]